MQARVGREEFLGFDGYHWIDWDDRDRDPPGRE